MIGSSILDGDLDNASVCTFDESQEGMNYLLTRYLLQTSTYYVAIIVSTVSLSSYFLQIAVEENAMVKNLYDERHEANSLCVKAESLESLGK